MSKLYVGFGRSIITPELGVEMHGYFQKRYSKGVLDDLEANVLAFRKDDSSALVITLDLCMAKRKEADVLRRAVSDATGVPVEAIYIAATHTHTGPYVDQDHEDKKVRQYFDVLKDQIVNAAVLAVADLKPAKMGWRVGNASNIAFNRRFRMKDGTIRTNPGRGNPDIDRPIGVVDDRVSVVRFDQENGESLVLVHYGMHPDTVGGCLISADWPGFVRRTVERAIPGTKCLFITGAQGDIGAQNVWATDGMTNDLELQFDDCWRGYGHTRYVGQVIAGAVLQVYAKANYRDVDAIRFIEKEIYLPSNKATPEQLEQAYKYQELHNAGRDDEIPFVGMQLTTVLGEASRMIQLKDAPDAFPMKLIALKIGCIALLGIPGEPFGKVGVELKKRDGWDLILPTCCTNGGEGYFPMMDSYEEGGYEARSSRFKAGVAEHIIEEGRTLLDEIRIQQSFNTEAMA